MLAAPSEAVLVAYDFAFFGVESTARLINLVDLLPALDHAQKVQPSLILKPNQVSSLVPSGVYLPDLVITPGLSLTPTAVISSAAPLTTPYPGGQPCARAFRCQGCRLLNPSPSCSVRGLYNAQADYEYTAAVIFTPQHVGVVQFYGSAGEAETLPLAASQALKALAPVHATLTNDAQSRLAASNPTYT